MYKSTKNGSDMPLCNDLAKLAVAESLVSDAGHNQLDASREPCSIDKGGVIQVQGRRFSPRWPVECPLYKPVFIASLHELVNGGVILVATNFEAICCKFWGLHSAFQVFWLDTF